VPEVMGTVFPNWLPRLSYPVWNERSLLLLERKCKAWHTFSF